MKRLTFMCSAQLNCNRKVRLNRN